MLQLAVELFLLVFVTTLSGFAAGFGCGRVFGRSSKKQSSAVGGAENHGESKEDSFSSDVAPVRRIPDPAPPSPSRRRRIAADGSPDPS